MKAIGSDPRQSAGAMVDPVGERGRTVRDLAGSSSACHANSPRGRDRPRDGGDDRGPVIGSRVLPDEDAGKLKEQGEAAGFQPGGSPEEMMELVTSSAAGTA